MSLPVTDTRFTYEHYCQLPEGDRYELIEGEFYLTPAPSEKHQRACGNFHYEFRRFLDDFPVGRVYIAPFDVILSTYSTVQPDVVFILQAHLDSIKHEGLRAAPDIAIEVLSPSTRKRDEELKRALYFKHGTRELFLVDPLSETVSVYTRQPSGLELWRTFVDGDDVVSLLLTDLKMPVRRLFI